MNFRTSAEIVPWLERWPWTHFVTLALNDPTASTARCRRLIKRWDARANRKLLGPKWLYKPDERLFAFYFLEKPNLNPHWHALVMLDERIPGRRAEQRRWLEESAECLWQTLKPSGTFNVKSIYARQGVCGYVAKELGYEVSYREFVVFREFE